MKDKGSLVCRSPQGRKESDTTERLSNPDHYCQPCLPQPFLCNATRIFNFFRSIYCKCQELCRKLRI